MLDPKDFIKNIVDETEEDMVDITGNFACPECNVSINKAKLNMDNRRIIYFCSDCNKMAEAKL
jgi:DNA-directed RNA polymerase subunit RPC12/RpoP